MYKVNIMERAAHNLAQLDKSVARRIADRINWLSSNLDNIKPEALTGDLIGFYKFRVGSYRIIYEILYNEKLIIIHEIGHRREIYRKR